MYKEEEALGDKSVSQKGPAVYLRSSDAYTGYYLENSR